MRTTILLAAIPLLIVCCLEGVNPLDVNTDLPLGTGAGNLPCVSQVAPSNRGQLLDDDPDVDGIQATVVVTFSDFMDEASLAGNVTVTNTLTGQDITNLSITYNADARKLYVRHADWTGSSAYLLTLKATNSWGEPIDGNRNGEADDGPYDDALGTFYTSGVSSDSCVFVSPPRISGVEPDTIRTTDTLPGITVTFDTPMDTTTLVAGNFTLTSESGSSVPLNRLYVSQGSVTFEPGQALRHGYIYTLMVASSRVLAEAPWNTPSYLLALDADRDGAEAAEPDYSTYFLCDTQSAPTVSISGITNGLRFDFDQQMDLATLTPENIRAFDGVGYIPGTLETTNHGPGNVARVDYYFSRSTSGADRAFVAKEVESEDGTMLDGQDYPNGIGGEPWDDFWW